MCQIHSLQTPGSLCILSSLSALKISNVCLFLGHSKLQVYVVVLRRLTWNLKSKLAPYGRSFTPKSIFLFVQCTINVSSGFTWLIITTCLGANGKSPSVEEWFPKDDDVIRKINKDVNSPNMKWLFFEEFIDGLTSLWDDHIINLEVVFIDVVMFLHW